MFANLLAKLEPADYYDECTGEYLSVVCTPKGAPIVAQLCFSNNLEFETHRRYGDKGTWEWNIVVHVPISKHNNFMDRFDRRMEQVMHDYKWMKSDEDF